jgi:PAS domain S-box-containing protein
MAVGGREELGEELQVLARAVDHVADIVEITDRDMRYQYVNAAFERVTGYTRDDVIGKSPADLLRSDKHTDAFYSDIHTTIGKGEVWSGRIVSRTRSDELLTFELTISPVLDDKGDITNYVAVRRDVTEREMVQSRLIQSERMLSIGQLASGVAHEINNPLAYVVANVNLLSDLLSSVGEALEPAMLERVQVAMADIETGAMRIRDIVRDLGTFASTSEEMSGPLDVHTVLDSAIRLIRNEIKHRAHLVRDFGAVSQTWADRSRLSQVFLNVLLNAVQAVPVGAAHKNEIRVRTSNSDNAIVVEIEDTGCGIASDVMPRILNPFFTTRPIGQGTGLGLSVAHGIVSALGGSLTIESTVDVGTTVRIELIPSERVMEQVEKLYEPVVRMGKRSRILLVDDEPAIQRAVRGMLYGYEVTTCGSGHDALDHLRKESYDALVCDLMMPELTGMDLYDMATDEHPELAERFVFMTGGAFTPPAQSFVQQHGDRVIRKPFEPDALRALMDTVLSTTE